MIYQNKLYGIQEYQQLRNKFNKKKLYIHCVSLYNSIKNTESKKNKYTFFFIVIILNKLIKKRLV
jgi:hypothetical protein